MATGARGEATIKAGERDVTILLTNRALVEAEKKLGKPITQVSGIGDIAQLLQAGMEAYRRESRGSGRVVSMDDAYAAMDAAGFAAVAAAVGDAMAAVLGYKPKDDEDDDPNATPEQS